MPFKRLILISLLLFVLPLSLFSEVKITIMSYNVHNLFDDVDDGSEYVEFRSKKSIWGTEKFEEKLKRLAQVIRKSCFKGADVIALQEVENFNALKLLRDRYLTGMGYNYAVVAPQEGIAVRVALLSRIPIRKVRCHSMAEWQGRPLRNILEAELEYKGNTFFIFNNHWKSKSGGVRQTEEPRLYAASVILRRIRSILEERPDADIVILGDLNENVEEYVEVRGEMSGGYQTALIPMSAPFEESYGTNSIFLADRPEAAGLFNGRLVLYEPWYELDPQERGSYLFQGRWQTPDHILLSAGFFDGQGLAYEQGDFKVEKSDLMLKWVYSDHLPLIIILRIVAVP
jgi:endonuclease/exonuclease/phosphatase family metal-dependent hydrolase